jgi:hypothetical protein
MRARPAQRQTGSDEGSIAAQEGLMTTPQQPDDDLKVKPELIQDLDVTGDDADVIAGGQCTKSARD